MPIPKLSSVNANYVASPKQHTIQSPNSSTSLQQPKKTENNLKDNKFAIAGLAISTCAIAVSAFALIRKKPVEPDEKLKAEFQKILEKIETLTASTTQNNKTQSTDVTKLSDIITEFRTSLNALMENITKNTSSNSSNSTNAQKLNDSIEQLTTKLKEVLDNISKNTIANNKNAANADALSSAINTLEGKIDNFSQASQINLETNLDDAKYDRLLEIIQNLQQTLKKYLDESQSNMQKQLEGLNQATQAKSKENSITNKQQEETLKIVQNLQQTLKEYLDKIQKDATLSTPLAQTTDNLQKAAQDSTAKAKDLFSFKDVTLKNGMATLKKDNSKLNGTVVDTLKDGRKIQWRYKDGLLQEAITGDSKTTYYRAITPFSKASTTIKEDSSPVQKITKRVEQDGITTIKQYDKVQTQDSRLKLQTKHFEMQNGQYIKSSVQNREERLNPKIYKGTIGEGKAKQISPDELQGIYEYCAFEDDGYKTYQLFLEKPQKNAPKPAEKQPYRLNSEWLRAIDEMINQSKV